MNNPEHISQWAWDKSEECVKSCLIAGAVLTEEMTTLIATALMEARAEERERCAAYLEKRAQRQVNFAAKHRNYHASDALISQCMQRAKGFEVSAQAIRENEHE